jgi:hypothetical protein
MPNSKYPNGHANSTVPPKIAGLSAKLQHRSKRDRARLALAIFRGATDVTSLTVVQAAYVCGVSPQYVHQILREEVMPPADDIQTAAIFAQLAAS